MDLLLITLLVMAISCFTLIVVMPLRWLADAIFGDRVSSGLANGVTGLVFVALGFGASFALLASAAGTS